LTTEHTRTIALGTRVYSKPRWHFFNRMAPYIFCALAGVFIGELAILYTRQQLIPQVEDGTTQLKMQRSRPATMSLSGVISRNIFNSSGVIPDAIGKGKNRERDMIPVESSLPITLVGTIVLSNPAKSVATLQVKGKNESLAYTPEKEIDQIATLVRVERGRIIIRNRNNGRLEFVENKNSNKLSFGARALTPEGPAAVKMTGENRFELSAQEVSKFTADLSSVVMQAATIPRRKSSGEIDGFTITSIQPNSVFTQLGFQPMDTLKSVNGEPLDSPAKAIELYNALKTSNSVKITVERDGRDMEFDYTIKK
jgi:general secretion pathway protein C